jgi:hypothetical protein
VSLSRGVPSPGYVDLTTETVYRTYSNLIATEPLPAKPGQNPAFDAEIAKIPRSQQQLLADKNVKIYIFEGNTAAAIPGFSMGMGQNEITTAVGLAFGHNNTIYIASTASPPVILHEIGHLFQYIIDDHNEWQRDIDPYTDFPTAYARTNHFESYAESYQRYILGLPNPPGVNDYFQRYLP